MEIGAVPGGGWITRFGRNGDTLAEDRSNTEPWIDRRAPGRLTKALATAAPRTPGPASLFTSKTPEWFTPPEILEAVGELFDGQIDLDPCSNSHEAPNVPALVHYTREDNGLCREWSGRVYLNPPYGKGIGPWIEKVREEHEAGRVTAAVVLVKAATDTRWFRVLSERYPRCEVAGRLKFSGCKAPAPFPSVLFYLGDEVQRFAEVFARFGVIVAPLPVAGGAEAAV